MCSALELSSPDDGERNMFFHQLLSDRDREPSCSCCRAVPASICPSVVAIVTRGNQRTVNKIGWEAGGNKEIGEETLGLSDETRVFYI